MLGGQSARSHISGTCPLVLCSAAQFLTTENLREDDKNIIPWFFFSFTALRVNHCSRVWFLYMVYLPKGSGVRFIFIISIMNPFIDDLHRPPWPKISWYFRHCYLKLHKSKCSTVQKLKHCWGILEESIPPFFFLTFTSVFESQLKFLRTKYAENRCLWWKHRRKRIATWRMIWVRESLCCLYDKRCVRVQKPLLLTNGIVWSRRTWKSFKGH